jgi:hypothetical protein
MSTKGPSPKSTLNRILAAITRKNDCWVWGSGAAHGYSTILLDKELQETIGVKQTTVHRAMYILQNGPIPAHLVVDHLCGVRNCVNPEHLELVTQAENVDRAETATATLNKKKTHCPTGHEYTDVNTHLNKNTNRRTCRSCHRKHQLEYTARQAERSLSFQLT